MCVKCVYKILLTLIISQYRLVRADELDLKSIAFPSLTSGVFGFPKEICAEIIVDKCVQ